LKELLNELQLLQNEVVNLVSQIPKQHYKQQFHPELSPLGWHLGHCIFIELYWIREQCLNDPIDDSLKSLYFPELSHKPSRGAVLPEQSELLVWAKQTQVENRELLQSLLNSKNKNILLENNFLIHFLIQHYSQHVETMHMALTERQLQLQPTNISINKKEQKTDSSEFKHIKSGLYEVGTDNKEYPYDNERPLHTKQIESFSISNLPVSNLEYKQFMEDGGYAKKEYWTETGWAWVNENQFKHPHHWRLNNHSDDSNYDDLNYYGIDHNGVFSLEDNQPVYGLSYYEAEAYANWKGMRLPHEHEWEVAASKNLLQQTGLVWEWCRNTFYPYTNFKAYPYEGYSAPYFDRKHYVLRGGSRYTKENIKRTSFRNYYTADKRHIFSGLRLVKD
jgi:iron(II)-dependent oxidoreductase